MDIATIKKLPTCCTITEIIDKVNEVVAANNKLRAMVRDRESEHKIETPKNVTESYKSIMDYYKEDK